MTGVAKKFLILGLVVLMFSPLFSQPAGAVGVGIGPSELRITNALRGMEYDRTVTVFNPSTDAGVFALRTEGVASGWITLYKLDDLTTPLEELSIAGEQRSTVLVKIKIPQDAANGVYNATIYAETSSGIGEEVEVGVGTVIQASSLVIIEVSGDQILAGAVDYVTLTDTEVNYPLIINVAFRNTGNVVANPRIDTTITRYGTPIDSFSYIAEGIKPGPVTIIQARWNATGVEVGDYNATVAVSLDGDMLTKVNLPFKVLPLGTLTREGILTELTYGGQSLSGPILGITGVFENIGKIETRAKLVGEVYRDGALVETFNTDELIVPAGRQVLLKSYIDIRQPGEYRVVAHAVYEGKMTDAKELTFTVGEPRILAVPYDPTLLAVLAVSASALAAGLYVVVRKRRG
ncbi:MAG: hypothetical protein QXJ75_05300 [Candidatus Bathyarchaeia archaeon]